MKQSSTVGGVLSVQPVDKCMTRRSPVTACVRNALAVNGTYLLAVGNNLSGTSVIRNERFVDL